MQVQRMYSQTLDVNKRSDKFERIPRDYYPTPYNEEDTEKRSDFERVQ